MISRAPRRPGRRAWLVLAGVGLISWTAMAITPVRASFSATTTTPGNQATAAATFPNYQDTVVADTDWATHRLEESASSSSTSAAADSSGLAHPGVYNGKNNGPSLHWRADENSGAALTDSSGAANAGTLGSATTWAAGYDGNPAVSMPGDTAGNSYVAATDPAVKTSATFTISAWVYLTDDTKSRIVASQSGAIGSGFLLRYNHYGDQWEFAMSQAESYGPTNDAVWSSNGLPGTNVWTHLVAVYDSGAVAGQHLKLFVDGVAQTPAGHTSVWNATGAFQVGRVKEFGAWLTGDPGTVAWAPWAGRIDDVRVYRRALSATEVGELATDKPITQWDFSEAAGSGTTTADTLGNDNTGTLDDVGTAVPTFVSAAPRSGNAVNVPYTDATNYGFVEGAKGGVRTDRDFSASAWVYITAVAARARAVVSLAGPTGSPFILKQDSVAPNKWAFMTTETDGGVQHQVMSNSGAATNAWVHLVGVYTDATDTIRLYVNGVLQTESDNTMDADWDAPAGTLEVGRNKWGGVFEAGLGGKVDGVRLYQRALTQTEVTALAAETEPAPLVVEAAMTAGIPGALQGTEQGQTATTAVAFAGTQHGYTNTSQGNPTAFTIECWFKVAAGQGGTLIALQSDKTSATSGTTDRALYVDSGGKVTFVVRNVTNIALRSSSTYNDGRWHHVAASLGPSPSADAGGMRLYVDGSLVTWGSNTGAYDHTTAYWRWGGSYLLHTTAFPNRPTSDYLVGALDEVVIYSTQLTDEQISLHYYANH